MKSLLKSAVVMSLLLLSCSSSSAGEKYIDLHLHLDGVITPAIAKELADLQNIVLPASDDRELESLLTVPDDCRDLNQFLERFALPLSLMQTPEGLRESVRLVLGNIASQGVIYAEVRFAPQLHTERGMTQEDAVRAALEGLKSSGIRANLILCMMRGRDNEPANRETLELAGKYLVKDGGVVALDLAGAEGIYPTKDYAGLFAEARERNIPFTIHAGEADGAESVRDAVEFGAARIGHGVRSFESPDVVAMLKERGIFLEMSPTSNRLTRAVPDMKDYPFMNYLREGLRVTLNTDDMAIERTTLADEFRYMREVFGLSSDDERAVLENAIDGAFTSDEVKKLLRDEI